MTTPSNPFDIGDTIRGYSAGQIVFERFELIKIIGRGGMGVVWLANDQKLEEEVALKFLPENVTHDAKALSDLKREVKRSRELTHPNIIRIHDIAEDYASAAIVMEYIAGNTLSELCLKSADGVLDESTLEAFMPQICAALDYAHEYAKIVHRDLKPANIMITESGRVKIADFGVARSLTDTRSRMTMVGASAGTMAYMSPQQLMGERPSSSDDIYALGATLFELLVSCPPFHSGDIATQIQHKLAPLVNEEREHLCLTRVPENWADLIARCLAKSPEDRPQSAAEVLTLLEGGAAKKPKSKVRKEQKASTRSISKSGKKASNKKSLILVLAILLIGGAGASWWYGYETPLRVQATQLTSEAEKIEQNGDLEAAQSAYQKVFGVKSAWPEAKSGLERVQLELKNLEALALAKLTEEQAAQAAEVRRAESEARRVDAERDRKVEKLMAEGRMAQSLENWNKAMGAYQKATELDPKFVDATAAVSGLKELLVNARGSIQVTVARGAEVKVDGEPHGVAPLRIDDLKLGEHTLVYSKLGYEPVEQKVVVKKDGLTTAKPFILKRQMGGMLLSSEPSGSDYLVKLLKPAADGETFRQLTGSTPAELPSLGTGQYEVSFTREGWPVGTEIVDLKPSEITKVGWEFPLGSIALKTEPTGCNYEIVAKNHEEVKMRKDLQEVRDEYKIKGLSAKRNKYLRNKIAELEGLLKSQNVLVLKSGKTPLEAFALPIGDYTVKLSRAGWASEVKSLSLTKGANETVAHEFKSGKVRITSIPSGATVKLSSGKVIGKTPYSGALPFGNQQITLSLSDYSSKMVRVKVGETAVSKKLQLSLKDRIIPEKTYVGTFTKRYNNTAGQKIRNVWKLRLTFTKDLKGSALQKRDLYYYDSTGVKFKEDVIYIESIGGVEGKRFVSNKYRVVKDLNIYPVVGAWNGARPWVKVADSYEIMSGGKKLKDRAGIIYKLE